MIHYVVCTMYFSISTIYTYLWCIIYFALSTISTHWWCTAPGRGSCQSWCRPTTDQSEVSTVVTWPLSTNHSSPGWCSPARRTASPCRRSRAWSRVQSPHRCLQNSGIWGKTENLFTTLKYYIYYLDIFNSKFKVSTGKARRETESVANFSQKVLKEFPCDKREVGESPRGTLKWNKNSILVQMWNRSPLVL